VERRRKREDEESSSIASLSLSSPFSTFLRTQSTMSATSTVLQQALTTTDSAQKESLLRQILDQPAGKPSPSTSSSPSVPSYSCRVSYSRTSGRGLVEGKGICDPRIRQTLQRPKVSDSTARLCEFSAIDLHSLHLVGMRTNWRK